MLTAMPPEALPSTSIRAHVAACVAQVGRFFLPEVCWDARAVVSQIQQVSSLASPADPGVLVVDSPLACQGLTIDIDHVVYDLAQRLQWAS